jgi:hypothetical protein
MGLIPKKILVMLVLMVFSALLMACSATPTSVPTATPTTDAVTIPPRVTPTDAPTATVAASPTSGSSTVAVSTVGPLTPGGLVTSAPSSTPAPTNTNTPQATTAAAAATTAARTNTPTTRTATPTSGSGTAATVPPPVASPQPSPSSLMPSGKLAFINEGEVGVYSLPANTKDNVRIGKAVDIAWSPEGGYLVALDKGELRIWEVNGNNLRSVKTTEIGDRVLVSAKATYALVAAGTQKGYIAKVVNLKTGATLSGDLPLIGGIGGNIMAGWHPTEQVLTYTTPENQPAADLVLVDVNNDSLKNNTLKPEGSLGYRFVRWLRNEAIIAKVDPKAQTDKAVKDVVKVNRDGKFSPLSNPELGVELDNTTLRLIPPPVLPEEEKTGLRLTYAPNLRFAAFTTYSIQTKNNQIFVLSIAGSNPGDTRVLGAGSVVAWQSRVPDA